MALGVVEHFEQHPELDAVGVRLDLARLGRQLVNGPRIFFGLALRRVVDELDVRIGDRDLVEIFIDGGAPLLIPSLDFEGHLSPPVVLPIDLLVLKNPRLVFLRVDLDLEVMGGRLGAGAGNNLHRLARRQLRVHARGGYADSLLSAAHAQTVKFGTVEKLREYPRNLLADDAGAVVDHGNPETVRLAGRRGVAVGSHLEFDDDFRQDPCFLACVEGVIDGLLDAGEQRFSRIVEAQQMTVLRKELGNRDLPLTSPHLDRR